MASAPVSVWQGSFTIFGVTLKCHVLSDGRRVIEADSIRAFLEAMEHGTDDVGDLDTFARWQAGRATFGDQEGP